MKLQQNLLLIFLSTYKNNRNISVSLNKINICQLYFFFIQERDGEEPPKVLEVLERSAGIRGAQMFFTASFKTFTPASIRASSCSVLTATKMWP